MCSDEKRTARLAVLAVMLMAVDWPGEQVVPAAKDWTTDQVPEPHCWNDVPSTQFQRPSGEQAEPGAVLPDGVTVEGAVLATGITEDTTAAGASEVLAAGGDEGAAVAAGALLMGTVAKTPAETAGAEGWAAGGAAGGVVGDPPEGAPHPAAGD